MTRLDRMATLARLAGRNRLLHFVVIGALLFAAAPRENDGRDATLPASRVDAALRAEQARLGRSLSSAEKEQSIATLIDDEVLAREAVRLGIGTDDPVIRARLSEQMRATLASTLPIPEIGEDELAAEIATRTAASPERVRLRVHFFRKDRVDAEAAARLAASSFTSGSAGTVGEDRAPIPDGKWWTEEALARAAGAGVAQAAVRTELGRASAPTASAWGLYVVVPLERRRAEPSEVRAEAYAAVRERKQAAALARVVERKRRDWRIEVRAHDGASAVSARGSGVD